MNTTWVDVVYGACFVLAIGAILWPDIKNPPPLDPYDEEPRYGEDSDPRYDGP